jgi:hypothetical protein
MSCRSNSFILRSSLRPLSRRVASPGGFSRCCLVPCIAGRSPHQLSHVDIPQTDAILVRPEAASMRPVDDGPHKLAAVAAADPPKLVRTARSGNEPYRSRGRRSDGDFCPSHLSLNCSGRPSVVGWVLKACCVVPTTCTERGSPYAEASAWPTVAGDSGCSDRTPEMDYHDFISIPTADPSGMREIDRPVRSNLTAMFLPWTRTF